MPRNEKRPASPWQGRRPRVYANDVRRQHAEPDQKEQARALDPPRATTWRRVDGIAAGVLADLQLRRNVERLYRLGPRLVLELLAELGAEYLIRAEIETKVARYAALDPTALALAGGDRFPMPPMRVVSS
jgi:hypothetical protein